MNPLPCVESFERWAVNCVSLPESRDGYKCILTMVDHETRWLIAISIESATSENVVEAQFKDLIQVYFVPSKLTYGRGQKKI